jgi:ABC-type antimicrobial peptide transport system permease subunit
MEATIQGSLLRERFMATAGAFLGISAALMAAIGLYCVMSHLVTRRTLEIGIRTALGADAWNVLLMLLRDPMTVVMVGVIIGIPASLGLNRYLQFLLFGLAPEDVSTIVGATLLLTVVSTVASLLPAVHEARLEPVEALRTV